MIYNRDSEGKFDKKYKYNWTKIFFIFIVLGIVIGGVYNMNKPIETKEVKSVVEKPTNSELDRIMNEENFKKATILRARKVASDNKREQVNAKYNQDMAEIEKENEAIRSEELVLVGTNSSLK